MRRIAALLVALAAVAVPALALALAAQKKHTRTIPVGDFYFIKDTNHTNTAHVAKGTLVKWHFVGMQTHNVTVTSGPAKFHSHDMDHGFFSHTVSKQGTYLIECTIHGFKMRLIVGKASAAPPPQPQPNPTPPPYPY